ncbi:MAG: ATP-binding protein [Pyrobaculum sp.]
MWGGIFIGLDVFRPVFLPLDRHVVITGPTRSGKTKLAVKIVKRARRPAVVLDWHGEYPHLKIDPRWLKIDLNFDKKLLSEVLGISLNLNEPSIYFLYRAIKRAEVRTIQDVITALDNFLVATKSEVEMKAAIARRLEYVAEVFDGGVLPIEALFKTKRPISVDLSKLRLYEERVLVSLFVLTSLYFYLSRGGLSREAKMLLVVDEAQNILGRGEVVKYLVYESAKFGLRVVLVSNEMPPHGLLVHSTLIITKPHFTYRLDVEGSVLIKDNKFEKIWII